MLLVACFLSIVAGDRSERSIKCYRLETLTRSDRTVTVESIISDRRSDKLFDNLYHLTPII